jgi:hypothetical protein
MFIQKHRKDKCLFYAVLEDKVTNVKFVVHTYHMPCAFWWPGVMTLHLQALFREIKRVSDDLPYILFGDFNSKQDSELHNYITNGALDESYYPLPNFEKKDLPILIDSRTACNF